MGLFRQLFVWWENATPGTLLTTMFSGTPVGADGFGNRYYQTKDGARRWVIYSGTVEASRVPPDWHGWLHHTFENPPTEEPLAPKPWEAAHPKPDRDFRCLSSRRKPLEGRKASAGHGRLRGLAARLNSTRLILMSAGWGQTSK